MSRRLVAFQDQSEGEITSWKWDFGDGTTSTERHPVHQYQRRGRTTWSSWTWKGPRQIPPFKVWDVQVR